MHNLLKLLTLSCCALCLQPTFAATDSTSKQISNTTSAAKHDPTEVITLDRIIAIVNNQVITSKQLNNAIQMAKRQMRLSNTPIPSAALMREQALKLLINQTLQLQLAKRAGMTVSDSELEAALNNIAARNHSSLSQLHTALASQGISYRDFREQIRRQILISKVQQGAVGSKITISAQEIKAMRKQMAGEQPMSYHLGDILISMPDNPTPQDIKKAKATAKSLIMKLNSGQSFKAVAAAYSASSNSVSGGDLGWKTLGEMPEVFADAVQHRLSGSVIGPVQAPNGMHILKIIGKRQQAASTANASTNQIRQIIWQRKFAENLAIWMQQIHNNTYIKIEN